MAGNEQEEQHQQQPNDNGRPRVVARVFTDAEFNTWLLQGLLHAVSAGDAPLTENMLRIGASPDSFVGEYGDDRVLHLAAAKGDGLTVSALAARGACKDAPNHEGDTPLHLAAKYDHVPAARALLDTGALVDLRNKFDQSSALDLASCAGHLGMVEVLIEHGADTNGANDTGHTALHEIAAGGNAAAVDLLVSRDASVHARDHHGQTPLHVAATNDFAGVVASLLNVGAHIDGVDSEGNAALHCAMSAQGYRGASQRLSGVGSTVSIRSDGDEWSPSNLAAAETLLHHAADSIKMVDTINELLGAGAKINAKNAVGRTPLHRACEEVSTEAVRCLLVNGATVNVPDKHEQSPLHRAASVSCDDNASGIVDMLLKADADEKAVDIDKRTPAQVVGHDFQQQEFWPTRTDQEDNAEVLHLLEHAQADRTWRRRRFLVMCRALPDKAPTRPDITSIINTSSSEQSYNGLMSSRCTKLAKVQTSRGNVGVGNGGGGKGAVQDDSDIGGGGTDPLVARMVGMGEEGIFQRIVSFL